MSNRTLTAGTNVSLDETTAGITHINATVAEVLIAEQTPSATGTVTFSSIAATYRNLRVVVSGRGDASANLVLVDLRFNGDTGANYDDNRGNWTTTFSGDDSIAATFIRVGLLQAATSPASTASSTEVLVYDYRGTTFHKHVQARSAGKAANAGASLNGNNSMGWWRSTAAITSVTVLLSSGNFVAGSVVSLYGMY